MSAMLPTEVFLPITHGISGLNPTRQESLWVNALKSLNKKAIKNVQLHVLYPLYWETFHQIQAL